MAQYKLSPHQVATINEAISFLDTFGTQHSQDAVFGEYAFYRRQTEYDRRLDALEALATTLRDIQQQLSDVRPQAGLPELVKQAKLLESQISYIVLGMRLMVQRHRARLAAARVGKFLIGNGKG